MNKLSKALSAADFILATDYATGMVSTNARLVAEELRRLHEVNQELVEALSEMLTYAADLNPMQSYDDEHDHSAVKQARAALKKLEESHD